MNKLSYASHVMLLQKAPQKGALYAFTEWHLAVQSLSFIGNWIQ